MKDLKSDYFESLTSFHKPIWIGKHGVLTDSHAEEIKQTRTNVPFSLEDHKIYDQSDVMKIDEEPILENYEIIDSDSRRILNRFLRALDSDSTLDIDQIANQARIINGLIEKAPFITMKNKDRSVRLESRTEQSVQAFDSVYARTRTTADGNCLYSSLSILNIGSEKLTHSMRLLAVNAMINRSDYFRSVCTSLSLLFERELERTVRNTVWGGEVQMLAHSVALSRPIYTYRFASDPESTQYVSSDISLQDLVDRFNNKTAGGHFKYVGYKADVNKLGFCIYYNGYHFDALLPFEDNPQQFVPHYDLITMTL